MNTRQQRAAKEARLKAGKEDLERTTAELQKNRDNITKIEDRIHDSNKLVKATRYLRTTYMYTYLFTCTFIHTVGIMYNIHIHKCFTLVNTYIAHTVLL